MIYNLFSKYYIFPDGESSVGVFKNGYKDSQSLNSAIYLNEADLNDDKNVQNDENMPKKIILKENDENDERMRKYNRVNLKNEWSIKSKNKANCQWAYFNDRKKLIGNIEPDPDQILNSILIISFMSQNMIYSTTFSNTKICGLFLG